MTERICLILHTRKIISDRHLISSMSSDKVCTMMTMRWCNVQANEYDLQAKTYPTICTHHKLHNTNENKFRFSRNVYTISDRIWCNKHLRHTTTETYENNRKGGYFRFDVIDAPDSYSTSRGYQCKQNFTQGCCIWSYLNCLSVYRTRSDCVHYNLTRGFVYPCPTFLLQCGWPHWTQSLPSLYINWTVNLVTQVGT